MSVFLQFLFDALPLTQTVSPKLWMSSWNISVADLAALGLRIT